MSRQQTDSNPTSSPRFQFATLATTLGATCVALAVAMMTCDRRLPQAEPADAPSGELPVSSTHAGATGEVPIGTSRTEMTGARRVLLRVLDHAGRPVPDVEIVRAESDGRILHRIIRTLGRTDGEGVMRVVVEDDEAGVGGLFAKPRTGVAVAFTVVSPVEQLAKLPLMVSQTFRCFDLRTNVPVPNALVTISPQSFLGMSEELLSPETTADCSATAVPVLSSRGGDDGVVEFDAIAPGDYVMDVRADGWAWTPSVERGGLVTLPISAELPLRPLVAVAVAVRRDEAIAWSLASSGSGWGRSPTAEPARLRALQSLLQDFPEHSVFVGMPAQPSDRPKVRVSVLWRNHGLRVTEVEATPVGDGLRPVSLRPPVEPSQSKVGTLLINVLAPDGSPRIGCSFRLRTTVTSAYGTADFTLHRTSGRSHELFEGEWNITPRDVAIAEESDGASTVRIAAGEQSIWNVRLRKNLLPCRVVLDDQLRRLSGSVTIVIRNPNGDAVSSYGSEAHRAQHPVLWLPAGRYGITASFAPRWSREITCWVDVAEPLRGTELELQVRDSTR